MTLDVLSALPLIIFKLPPYCPKRITRGNVWVFVRTPFVMFPMRDDLSPRRGYPNVDFVELSLMTMLVR